MSVLPERKIVAIQYWNGDREDALRLSRYMTDIEPAFNPDVDLVFMARSDAELPDKAHLLRAARKFNVKTVKAPHAGVGHPHGCWVLWYSLLEWLLKRQEAGEFSAKWMATLESDGVPLTRDWIKELDREWDSGRDIRIMGANPTEGVSHINGNLLVSGKLDFLKWLVRDVAIETVPDIEGWDTFLFPQFLRWGCLVTERMLSAYRTPGVGQGAYEHYLKQGYVFVHGVKDDSLLRQARRHLLGSAIQT